MKKILILISISFLCAALFNRCTKISFTQADTKQVYNLHKEDMLYIEQRIDKKSFDIFMNKTAQVMDMRGQMSQSMQPTHHNTHIPLEIIFDSPGGDLEAMNAYIETLSKLRILYGIRLKCYIYEAMSAAFTIAVTQCNEIYLLKGGKMMTHYAYIKGKGVTISTIHDTRDMARLESTSLGIPFEKWFKISRIKGKNKYYTVEEMKKYNIIDREYGK